MSKRITIWLVVPGIVLLGLSAMVSRTESHGKGRAETSEEARARTGISALVVRAQSCQTNGRADSCLLLGGAETDWNGVYRPAGTMNDAPFYRRDSTHFLAFNGKGDWGLVAKPEVINIPIANWHYCARGGKTVPTDRWIRMAGII